MGSTSQWGKQERSGGDKRKACRSPLQRPPARQPMHPTHAWTPADAGSKDIGPDPKSGTYVNRDRSI